MAFLQNQKKPSQLKKLIILIRTKMIHKGENYKCQNAEILFLQRNPFNFQLTSFCAH